MTLLLTDSRPRIHGHVPVQNVVCFVSPAATLHTITLVPQSRSITTETAVDDAIRLAKLLRSILPQATYAMLARQINNETTQETWDARQANPEPEPPKPKQPTPRAEKFTEKFAKTMKDHLDDLERELDCATTFR